MQAGLHTSYDCVKRCLDIIFGIMLLVIAIPIFLIAILMIKKDSGPVFFRQTRVGLRGRSFSMLKFRTMVPNAHIFEDDLRKKHEESGGYGVAKSYNDPRITKVGSILRLANLDELPQIINILKGDMSFVGPRPVPYDESLLYGDKRDLVLSVRPGLTGYWQIKRRMDTDYASRVFMDCFYVRSRSLMFDSYIILMTPVSMITSDYNSVSKPLPPKTETINISHRVSREKPV